MLSCEGGIVGCFDGEGDKDEIVLGNLCEGIMIVRSNLGTEDCPSCFQSFLL